MYPSNQICIDEADRDLQSRVVSFLRSRHFPSFLEIDVDVVGGVVRLSGQVRLFYEKQVALNSCRRVAGVLTLIDDVNVIASEHDTMGSRKPR